LSRGVDPPVFDPAPFVVFEPSIREVVQFENGRIVRLSEATKMKLAELRQHGLCDPDFVRLTRKGAAVLKHLNREIVQ
jgi:hypothetical protein